LLVSNANERLDSINSVLTGSDETLEQQKQTIENNLPVLVADFGTFTAAELAALANGDTVVQTSAEGISKTY
jgi:hypothetical protein